MMGSHHRKMLLGMDSNSFLNTRFLSDDTSKCSELECVKIACKGSDDCDTILSPPPPLPPRHQMPLYLPLMLCIGAAALIFICCLSIKRYRSRVTDSRRSLRHMEENREEFIDENQGPVIDHPIWYIRTIGLPQSIIDSITIFKYKKDECLVEGTDCSVCLSEFQEDESLRLLPKCSHAFHIPCIDTWLRSHKNCPLCRAPIMCNTDAAQRNTGETNVNGSVLVEEAQLENIVNNGESEGFEMEEETDRDMRLEAENINPLSNEEGRLQDNVPKIPAFFNVRNGGIRVLSDLAEHRVKVEEELQAPRRSISMDSSAASLISIAVANVYPVKGEEGSSTNQPVHVRKQSLDIVVKQENRNSSLYKPKKSSSFGRSLPKMPVSMMRSLSSSGKCSLPTHSKSQDSSFTL